MRVIYPVRAFPRSSTLISLPISAHLSQPARHCLFTERTVAGADGDKMDGPLKTSPPPPEPILAAVENAEQAAPPDPIPAPPEDDEVPRVEVGLRDDGGDEEKDVSRFDSDGYFVIAKPTAARWNEWVIDTIPQADQDVYFFYGRMAWVDTLLWLFDSIKQPSLADRQRIARRCMPWTLWG